MLDQFTQTLGRLVGVCLLLAAGLAHAEDGEVSATIVNVIPEGHRSILVLNRGLRAGARVGQVARCVGPPAFSCRLTESYEFRSKCIADMPSGGPGMRGSCRLALPTPVRVPARILEVFADGDTTTFVFDKGHAQGVRLTDWAELDGRRCRIWRLENERAACAIDGEPGSTPTQIVVVSAFSVGGGALGEPLLAPPIELTYDRPTRGEAMRARPVGITRAHGHGLVVASRCVGFTPDEGAAYVFVPSTTRLTTWPAEPSLQLQRVDLATGYATVVHTFDPTRVLDARRRLSELVEGERLLACHEAEPATRSTAGDKGLMAHHRLDRILFWSSEGIIYAAMEGGAGLAERVGRGALDAVWFVPGFASHLGRAGDDWQVLKVH